MAIKHQVAMRFLTCNFVGLCDKPTFCRIDLSPKVLDLTFITVIFKDKHVVCVQADITKVFSLMKGVLAYKYVTQHRKSDQSVMATNWRYYDVKMTCQSI